jgi:hypothetical protein
MSFMRHRYLALFLGIAGVFSPLSQAQAKYTAQRKITLQAGVGFTVANPDYSQSHSRGISAFVMADLPRNWGIEFDYHNADIVSPSDVGEISYLAGVRYRFPHHRMQPYVKGMIGVGQVKFDQGFFPTNQTVTNTVIGFGGGFEYMASRRIVVRAVDFEFQKWPNFTPHTLSPWVFTSGIAYKF